MTETLLYIREKTGNVELLNVERNEQGRKVLTRVPKDNNGNYQVSYTESDYRNLAKAKHGNTNACLAYGALTSIKCDRSKWIAIWLSTPDEIAWTINAHERAKAESRELQEELKGAQLPPKLPPLPPMGTQSAELDEVFPEPKRKTRWNLRFWGGHK